MVEQLLGDQRREAEAAARRAARKLRPAHQGAGDREHLLLAARQAAGLLRAAFPQAGERSRTTAGPMSLDRPSRSCRTYAPTRRLSSTVRSVNVPRPCGTWAMPRPADLLGRCPDELCPVEGDAAAARDHAGDGSDRRGLAGAVGAEDHDDLAFVDVQVDAASTWTGPYAGAEPAHGEHERSPSAPEVGLDDARIVLHVGGGPSAILRPKSSTTTLSEMPITIAMWCSTSSTVRPNWSRIDYGSSRRARRPRRASDRRPARRAAASRGLAASARASSIRLRVPNGRPAAGRWARSARPSKPRMCIGLAAVIRVSSRRTPMRNGAAGEVQPGRGCGRRPSRSRARVMRREQGQVLEGAGDAERWRSRGRGRPAGRRRRTGPDPSPAGRSG